MLTILYKFAIKNGTVDACNVNLPLTNNASDRAVDNDQIPQTILSFKYRLLPTKTQHKKLAEILEQQRQIYNACLESRIDCYRKTGKTISYFMQGTHLTELRKEKEFSDLPANLHRATLQRIDRSYKNFFSRIKRGAKAGFPRFKGKKWFTSFGFAEFSGIRFDGKHIRFKGLCGGIRVHMHRSLPKDAKFLCCTFKRDYKGWSVSFQIQTAKTILEKNGNQVGVDVGLDTLAFLSTGKTIPNVRPAKRAARELRRLQRALARCKKGSKRRTKVKIKVTRCYAKIANKRQTYLHQVSAKLVRENDLIAIENLNVSGFSGSMLAKSINDASWGKLREYLTYKAANAGRELIAVDPRYTSQICPECGIVKKKELSQRIHSCECGCVLDRDHAAAIVILQRAVLRPRFDKAA